ncbi:4Fe-4S double cluster binding domain-containing protein [Desulfatibacillum alkenivorans DSM 16219]|jgi:epoxyqueuosine reductase QueG|uniref:4Fe-4S double cluster binding domain-containing protein n=1 Tax=Desulfatibacillum alkenivorans DSM 16219 TaxID=1121393 RepID=A0A1M6PW32_9BACT|nr:4Fe-4S double cluster binding domain-containing protein [Desulfatibacillum alkenivorans]SHK12112.1 4Fe-4S double cluster binding domain-containing protein [Desulfatibacillum alkenivorans DSM 16219]
MASKDQIKFAWLNEWMSAHGVELWGGADLQEFETPTDEHGDGFPGAVSFGLPMSPEIMQSIRKGPNHAYAAEYTRVNNEINRIALELAHAIWSRGFRAKTLAASMRTDYENIRGDFPHKTAATRAGLGWIGRHCQLVTRPYGPWVRLGTVFTDMPLDCGPVKDVGHCGTCRKCVEACPAGALSGKSWRAGAPREDILDAQVCDMYKKTHFFEFHKGHNCGICTSACPYGKKRAE